MPGTDPVSELFSSLTHPHRRIALYYLDEHDWASLETLAQCITGWLQSGPGAPGIPDDFETVRLLLRHQHLPQLGEAGFVDYDAAAETIRLGDLPDGAGEILAAGVSLDVRESAGAEAEATVNFGSLVAGDADSDGN